MTTPSNPVKLVLIGAGNIAREDLKVLGALPDVVLAGIATRTRAKAEALATEYGIQSIHEDAVAMIREIQPDGVLLLVSADQIATMARRILPLGGTVFIEKPAGLSAPETRGLAELAARHGTRTMVGYNRRYYSLFQQGLDLVRAKGPLLGVHIEGHERIFRVRAVTSHAQAVYDAWLYGNATHTIDLLRYFGGEIHEMKAVGSAFKEPLGDQFSAAIRFEGGAIGTYLAHWYSPGGWRVVLYGDGITVEFKPLEEGRWTDAGFVTHTMEPAPEDRMFKPGFYRQMKAFVELIGTGVLAWPGLDLASAAQTMDAAAELAMAAVGKATVQR